MAVQSPNSGHSILVPRSMNSLPDSSATDLANLRQALLLCLLPLIAFVSLDACELPLLPRENPSRNRPLIYEAT